MRREKKLLLLNGLLDATSTAIKHTGWHGTTEREAAIFHVADFLSFRSKFSHYVIVKVNYSLRIMRPRLFYCYIRNLCDSAAIQCQQLELEFICQCSSEFTCSYVQFSRARTGSCSSSDMTKLMWGLFWLWQKIKCHNSIPNFFVSLFVFTYKREVFLIQTQYEEKWITYALLHFIQDVWYRLVP